MDKIRLKAMAKVNLGLDVVRRRPDGYHEVRMVMQMVNLYDQIYIEKISEPGIRLRTNLVFLPTDERNIAYKAAKLLMDEYHIKQGVSINIEKHIPVAAGMAGGSTDCAAVLYGINRLFHLGLSRKALMRYGVQLGADVPYCLLRQTALSEGIGEILTPVSPMPECHILIAKPPISVSTKHVYEQLQLDEHTFHPDIDGIVESLMKKNLDGITMRLGNVLETVTIPEHPVIDRIKTQMLASGAENALMSGSGPTVFGIFKNKTAAEKAYSDMRASGLAKQVYLTRPFNVKNKNAGNEVR
jgi:4-diphosphocytidyl-2-C-methyl-D-erythritol kinase